MLALCLMLSIIQYAQNYAGIIGGSLLPIAIRIFCSSYPVILFIIAIVSYIAILLYEGSTFEERSKVFSYIDL